MAELSVAWQICPVSFVPHMPSKAGSVEENEIDVTSGSLHDRTVHAFYPPCRVITASEHAIGRRATSHGNAPSTFDSITLGIASLQSSDCGRSLGRGRCSATIEVDV